MNFSILQSEFWPILQSVSRSCGVRSTLPVLGNVLIEAKESKVKLSATNLEIGVVKNISAEIIEEGDITVPVRTLSDIISNLAGSKINIEAVSDQLKISTDSFSSQINGIPASEFPSIPLSGKEEVIIDPEILKKAVPEIAFAAAVDEGRPVLTGILTQIQDKKLQLVSTDGYRLAHKLIPVDQTHEFKALIPRKTFEEVIRLLSESEADNLTIATSEDGNQMIFRFGNTQLSSRLIEGQFPAWEKIIPTEANVRIIFDRVELLKGVKLASVFARFEANVVKLQNQDNKLILTSEAKELGSQQNQIEVQSNGDGLTMAFSAKFLIDALSAFSASQAILELSGPLSAATIKPMGEEGLQYIIMPVNLG